MSGVNHIVNSDHTKNKFIATVHEDFKKHGYVRYGVTAGKRTLSQNALKSVFYKEIAMARGDCTAKDVERECKFIYGSPILRRDPFNNMLLGVLDKFENTRYYSTSLKDAAGNQVQLSGWEIKMKAMDRYAVTSIMSPLELSEYIEMMKSDYPYLKSKKEK